MDPKRQRLVAGVLVMSGILVWVWGLTAKPSRSKRSASQRSPAVAQPEARPSAQRPVASSDQPSRFHNAPWGDNPFLIERRIALPAEAAGPTDPILSGILWDPEFPSAVVNSRVVAVGDSLGPWQVLEIRKKEVILSDGVNTKVLRVE